MKILISCFTLIFLFSNVKAQTLLGTPYLKTSAKSKILGGAYTARSEGSYSLFHNPASLGAHHGFSIHPLNLGLGVSNIVDDLDRFDNMPSDPVAMADKILDYPIHFDLQGAPGFKLGNFGFSVLLNMKSDAILTNSIHPVLDLDYRYDNGFIVGYGYNFIDNNRQRSTLGIATKYIKRKGINDRISLTGTEVLNALNSGGDVSDILESLGASQDKAWGFDVAYDYQVKSNLSSLTASVVIQDIYTKFQTPDAEHTIPSQPMILSTGLAYSMDIKLMKLTLSADLHPMNLGYTYSNQLHLGAELELPVVTFLVGYKRSGFSYGIETNLYFMKLMAGFYQEDVGTTSHQVRSKRALIYLSLLDFSFDS